MVPWYEMNRWGSKVWK